MWLEGPVRTEVHSKHTQNLNYTARRQYLGMHTHSKPVGAEAVLEAAGRYMGVFHKSAFASTEGGALVGQVGGYKLPAVRFSELADAHTLVAYYSRAPPFLSVPAGLVLSAALSHDLLISRRLELSPAADLVLPARGIHRKGYAAPRMQADRNLAALVDLPVPAHYPPFSQICYHCVEEVVGCQAFAVGER